MEANGEHSDSLGASGFPFVISLLGDTTNATPVDFYSLGTDTGASVFVEVTGYYQRRAVRRTRRRMIRGDDVKGIRSRSFDMIKIDVQGAELMVLRGIPRTLSRANMLLVETSLVPYNKNAPLIAPLVSFLDGVGWRLVDIEASFRVGPAIVQADALFVNKDGAYYQTAARSIVEMGAKPMK